MINVSHQPLLVIVTDGRSVQAEGTLFYLQENESLCQEFTNESMQPTRHVRHTVQRLSRALDRAVLDMVRH